MSLLSPLFLQSFAYGKLEASMCTGDIVLYRDTSVVDNRALWASTISRALAMLPCNTYLAASQVHVDGSMDGEWDDQSTVELDSRQWVEWNGAYLVVQMTDETETNPTRDPKKEIPYGFLVDQFGNYALLPMRELLRQIVDADNTAHSYFALRQLKTVSDGVRDRFNLGSMVRSTLRTQILDFYQATIEQAKGERETHTEQALTRRWLAISEAVRTTKPEPHAMEKLSVKMSPFNVALFRANPCYLVLYTLFKATVLRVEPTIGTAIASIQEGGSLQHQLRTDWSLSDEIVFYYLVSRGVKLNLGGQR